jgi:two-component system chemotaxis response regulator CheY
MTYKRVLIADDAEGVRTLLKRVYETLIPGYQVVVASDAYEALDQLSQGGFELLVTDYHMPGPNGLELAGRVRELSPATRIVLMSGNGVLKDGPGEDWHIDAYLEKPFTLGQVMVITEKVMKPSRA